MKSWTRRYRDVIRWKQIVGGQYRNCLKVLDNHNTRIEETTRWLKLLIMIFNGYLNEKIYIIFSRNESKFYISMNLLWKIKHVTFLQHYTVHWCMQDSTLPGCNEQKKKKKEADLTAFVLEPLGVCTPFAPPGYTSAVVSLHKTIT